MGMESGLPLASVCYKLQSATVISASIAARMLNPLNLDVDLAQHMKSVGAT